MVTVVRMPATRTTPAHCLAEEDFLRYVAAFNARDYELMTSYYHPDVRFELPGLAPMGRAEIKAFYQDFHTDVTERLAVEFLMIDAEHVAAELYTEFHAINDRPDFTARPLRAGDVHRSTNLVHYDLLDGLFVGIRVGRYRVWGPDEHAGPERFPGVPS